MKKLLYIISALLMCLPAYSQNQNKEPEDSLVVLMSSKSAQLVDIAGASYRKVVGPARFLHNNTYLICDTALWNVDAKLIEAWGNVSILQDETVLTSDKLTYLIEQDLAQFRGSLVQLQDKDHNILRTSYLDYNTKDSLAVFRRGGSMRDKDGQIIESDSGTYDSKIKTFTFEDDVNMFTDSVFVKTRKLTYESEKNLATFGFATYAWQKENQLASNAGWYDRGKELFFFNKNVHVMSDDQEAWSDSLYFNRMTNCVEMLGHVQVTDTTRNVYALAGRIEYLDSLSKITLTREPAVISQTQEKSGVTDTVYLGAEKLVYYAQKRCDVDSLAVVDSKARLDALAIDPIGELRKKAAEAAAKAAEEAAMNDPNQRAKREAEQRQAEQKAAQQRETEKKAAQQKKDAGLEMNLDAVDKQVAQDSTAQEVAPVVKQEAPDTTKIGFLEALRNVRIFKKDMQVVCDSLVYTDLDSLARLYVEPVVWQDSVRQYSADSITVVVSDGKMQKASLMSNAFITIQEDPNHFDQIKGAEMIAYFDGKGGLTRFDALGGASALFFLEENDALATVNRTDSKMLSAVFKDGNIQKIYYFEEPKNDGYPVVQLAEEERQMKGFKWNPERRPSNPKDVTALSLRSSDRTRYSKVSQPKYDHTEKYFPGYIGDIRQQIAVRDSLRQVRERERALAEKNAAQKAQMDSLMRVDSLSRVEADSLAKADSLKNLKPVSDSKETEKQVADTTAAKNTVTAEEKQPVEMDGKALKEEKKKQREAKKLQKQKEREARWAEKDKKDEEKAKAKEEKRKEKERQNKREALKDMAKQAEKDAAVLQKYKEKYELKKAAEQEKERSKANKDLMGDDSAKSKKAARKAESVARKADKAARKAEKADRK